MELREELQGGRGCPGDELRGEHAVRLHHTGSRLRSATGRWLGFGKDFVVYSGDWHLEWLEA